MKKLIADLALLILTAGLLLTAGCSNNQPQSQSAPLTSPTAAAPTSTSLAPSPEPTKTFRTGSITATPNPVKVCDGSNSGITTLSWAISSPGSAHVHVNAPDGPVFSQTGNEGRSITGKWVTDGMVFYLQDGSSERPTAAANTIATATIKLTTAGCP
jgi:hypothetical protein